MISARQVFLAIQYLDPDSTPPGLPEIEQEMDEEDISNEEVLQTIQYLDADLEKTEDAQPREDEQIFRAIQYLDPDLDRAPTVFGLRWLPKWVRRSEGRCRSNGGT